MLRFGESPSMSLGSKVNGDSSCLVLVGDWADWFKFHCTAIKVKDVLAKGCVFTCVMYNAYLHADQVEAYISREGRE